MADYTDAFQGFRAGMQDLAAARSRRKQEGFQQEALELEKQRNQREAAQSEITVDLAKRRRDRMLQPPTVPEGMEVAEHTTDEYGNPVQKYRRATLPFDPKRDLQEIPGGHGYVITNPNTGAQEVIRPDVWGRFFNGSGQPMDLEAPQAPGAPQGAPTPRAPGAAGTRGRMVITGMGPNGPTMSYRYDVEEPTIVEKPLPDGSMAMFMQERDPQTGQIKLSPYSRPESAGRISDRTTTQQNLDAARRYAQQLKDAIARSGTWESRFGNTEDAAAFEQVPYLLAISLAKVLDPGSVAREGEVNAAKKFLIPLGMLASGDVATSAVDRLMRDLEERAAGLGLENPGRNDGAPAAGAAEPDFADEASAQAAVLAGQIKPGDRIRIGGKLTQYVP